MKTKPYSLIQNYRCINIDDLLNKAEVHALPSVDWSLRSRVRDDAKDAIDHGFEKKVTWGDDGSVFVSCGYAIAVLNRVAAEEEDKNVGAVLGYVADTLISHVPEEDRNEVLIELYQGA